MKKNKYNYKHIVSGKIEEREKPHPFDNMKDKTTFVNLISQDLEINDFEDISGDKKNLFKFHFKDTYYNIFIEFVDGGGKDITQNSTSKKVSIPYQQKAFNNTINNYERVLVINIYIPLDQEGRPDFLKRVYLIVDPKEIYSSKVIEQKTWNSSSRWVKLEDILDVINNKGFKTNNKKNVYIIYYENLKYFFDNTLKEKYDEMIVDEMKNAFKAVLNGGNGDSKKWKKFRRLFRARLISKREIKCEIINCKIKNIELLIASHIKPFSTITSDATMTIHEKGIESTDPNNGFLLCPNHDALFDKFLITFDSSGVLKTSKLIESDILQFNLVDKKQAIKISNENVIKYLKFHNQEFERQNGRDS